MRSPPYQGFPLTVGLNGRVKRSSKGPGNTFFLDVKFYNFKFVRWPLSPLWPICEACFEKRVHFLNLIKEKIPLSSPLIYSII